MNRDRGPMNDRQHDCSDQDHDAVYKQVDADFKIAVHNADILSHIIKGFVKELKDEDIEFIKKCVSPEDMSRIEGLNTQLINDGRDYVVLDNLFRVDIPGESSLGLILNIETQGDPTPGYPLFNRALFYSSGVIFNQKGTVFKGSDYGDMMKTYSIWFVLNSERSLANCVFDYTLVGERRIPSDGPGTPQHDMLEIIIVYLGGPESRTSDRAVEMMNDILLSKLGRKNRSEMISAKYNITLDDNTLGSLERIGMSLGEEIRTFQRREGAEEQARKDRIEHIENYTKSVLATMRRENTGVDETLDNICVPEDIREDVRAKVLSMTP